MVKARIGHATRILIMVAMVVSMVWTWTVSLASTMPNERHVEVSELVQLQALPVEVVVPVMTMQEKLDEYIKCLNSLASPI